MHLVDIVFCLVCKTHMVHTLTLPPSFLPSLVLCWSTTTTTVPVRGARSSCTVAVMEIETGFAPKQPAKQDVQVHIGGKSLVYM